MNSKSTISLYESMRQIIALILSLLLIPAAQLELYAQPAPSAYVGLDAVQLDQLVAPIALYPDSLVAQILTASTYPDQVGAADTWLNQNMNLPPDQRAAGANAMPWDPSVKGLVEFPAVLDNLAKNTAWASQLGNAYYNQPGDVMNSVQAMRLQAQQSNRLVSTPQQRVVVDAGVINIVPVNPSLVYVPYYNPWAVWGGLFTPYPGYFAIAPPVGIVLGLGLAFGVGIGIGAFAGFGWGFGAWSPGWRGGNVLYGGRSYISNSRTVLNHGNFGAHDTGAFEHGGRGVPGGFHAAAHVGAARSAAANAGGARGGAGGGRSAFAGRGGAAGGARGGAAGGARAGAAGGARGGAAGGARGGAAGGARGGAAGGARAGAAGGARGGAAGGARGGAAGGARGGAAGGARGGAAGGARGGAAGGARGGAAGGARGGAAGGARGGAAGGARGGAAGGARGGAAGGARGGAARPAGGGHAAPAGHKK